METQQEIRWEHPLSSRAQDPNYSLVILNRAIPLRFQSFAQIWENAKMKVCASGGANRLYEFVPEASHKNFVPDFIKGSLETVLPHVKDFYVSQGTDVIFHSREDASAFTKCVHRLSYLELGHIDQAYFPNSPIPPRAPDDAIPSETSHKSGETHEVRKRIMTGKMCIVMGGLDGRFDQQMDVISTAFAHPEKQFLIMGNESFLYILQPGLHRIDIDREIMGEHCGLIPLGSPCRVHTTGLKWNLDESRPLFFGGLISSSNTYVSPDNFTQITVQTDNPLVFTANLACATQRFSHK